MATAYYPTISRLHGVAFDRLDSGAPDNVWHLSDGEDLIPCMIPCRTLAQTLRSQPLIAHTFQVAGWSSTDNAVLSLPILVSATADADPEHPLRFLPSQLCPVTGVVEDTLDLIHQIETEPLRRLVEGVFVRRDVAQRYWKMPASWQHHHAFPGGLAQHSLEVAQVMERQGSLSRQERELGIAGALLHDIGKVWSYTDDMHLTGEANALGHERIALGRLSTDLAMLSSKWHAGAQAIVMLLEGSTRHRCGPSIPSSLIARFRAADQRGCARQGHNEHRASTPLRLKGTADLTQVSRVPESKLAPF